MPGYRRSTKPKRGNRKDGGYVAGGKRFPRRAQMRTAENPYILQAVAADACNSKFCAGCGRWIRKQFFPRVKDKRDGIGARCNDCMYMQNTFGYTGIIVQQGEPLQRRVYLGRDPHNNFDVVSRIETAMG